MFIICMNDFPFLICPHGASLFLAQKIAEHFQEKCGCQLGLSNQTYYHVQEAELVPEQLIEQLEMEIENGSEETRNTLAPEIGSNNQTTDSTKGKGVNFRTSEEL